MIRVLCSQYSLEKMFFSKHDAGWMIASVLVYSVEFRPIAKRERRGPG